MSLPSGGLGIALHQPNGWGLGHSAGQPEYQDPELAQVNQEGGKRAQVLDLPRQCMRSLAPPPPAVPHHQRPPLHPVVPSSLPHRGGYMETLQLAAAVGIRKNQRPDFEQLGGESLRPRKKELNRQREPMCRCRGERGGKCCSVCWRGLDSCSTNGNLTSPA